MVFNAKKIVISAVALLFTGFMASVPVAHALQRLQTGMEAPDFSLKALDGKVGKFAELKGEKLTAVVFWSLGSKKSEPLLARMQKLLEMYRDKGFAVIAINADGQNQAAKNAPTVKALGEKLKIDFPMLMDDGLEAFNNYGIIALPTTVIIDPSRIIKYELSGFPLEGAEEMADFLAESFTGKKPSAPAGKPGHQPAKNAIRAFNMGNTSLKSKRTADNADIWFKKAVEADPEFILPRLALGKFYSQKGDNVSARKEFEQALLLEPRNTSALCELSVIAVAEGKTEEAKGFIDRALATEAMNPECYGYAGYVYAKLGTMDKALQLFDEGDKLNSADVNLMLYKARTFEECGRQQEAAANYRQALEMLLQQH